MLSQSEELVKKAIKKSDVPFLGLLAETFTPALKFSLEIAILANPSVNGYVSNLKDFPALFAVNLTAHIMQGMGQAGHFDLYSHVQRAIGINRQLSSYEKELLWDAFRKAILTLGFEPSPRTSGNHFMANEYLRQVGVPLAFVDDLAARMLVFAKRVGLPDEDDPDALSRWQLALDVKLDPPFSKTARKAVSMDTIGYYTQVFLRVHGAAGQLGSAPNALEKAMARAFESQPGTLHFRRAVLPYLMLHQGTLGMFIPNGDEREFELCVDHARQTVRAGAEEKFIPIHESLPKEVILKEASGNQSIRYQLWEDHKPNRLLVFSDSGRFKEAAQLNQAFPLIVPPGDYTILSRFCPAEIEAQELCDEPQLYAFQTLVRPGQAVTWTHGPAKIVIQGDSQPFARWIGQSKTTKEGVEFFFGALGLEIEFPKEWLALSGRNYLLRLSATASGEQFELRLPLDEVGKIHIALDEEMGKRHWKAGFSRLLVEVYRSGEGRSLLRSSVFYWNGLKAVSKALHFECSTLPGNLVQNLCENIIVTKTSVKPHGLLSRTLRIVFQLDARRNQSLTWNIPGVFVEVEVSSESGTTLRHHRPLGSIEVISYTSPKQILISASEAGELRFGEWSHYFDFERTQVKRLSAAFLAGHITPQSKCLSYRNGKTGVELDLLRLVQPHYAQAIATKIASRQLIVKFLIPKALDAITINAHDMISGENTEISLEANKTRHSMHRFCQAQFMCLKGNGGGYVAYVYIELETWPNGAWVMSLDGAVDGVWGHLTNERQDQFAVGLLSNGHGGTEDPKEFVFNLSTLSDKQSLDVLHRVHTAMLPCYTVDSWASLQWLLAAWRNLLFRWKGREADAIESLMELASCCPPEDSAASWMLQQTVGSSLPSIFCLPAQRYDVVPLTHHPFTRTVSVLASFRKTYPAVFPHLLHSAAAAGFTNFLEFARGGRPRGFSIPQYRLALQETGGAENSFRLYENSFQIAAGDYLGPLHFKYAMRQLEDKYECGLAGNDLRRGQAIGMSHHVCRLMSRLNHEDSPRLAGCPPHLDPWPAAADDSLAPHVAQRQQNLHDFSHFLSCFAYHCRLEAKLPGHLETFLSKLHQSGIPIESSLSYLLQIGDELFAFYLVFWELVITAEHIGG